MISMLNMIQIIIQKIYQNINLNEYTKYWEKLTIKNSLITNLKNRRIYNVSNNYKFHNIQFQYSLLTHWMTMFPYEIFSFGDCRSS